MHDCLPVSGIHKQLPLACQTGRGCSCATLPFHAESLCMQLAHDGLLSGQNFITCTGNCINQHRRQNVAHCRGTFATQRTPKSWQGVVNTAPSLWQRLQKQAENALDLYVKNTANTNVILWGGRLLALFEVRRLSCGPLCCSHLCDGHVL